jgi:hypothetical protein
VVLADASACAMLSAGLKALGAPPPGEFFSKPESYRGLAAKKARQLAARYVSEMDGLSKALGA